MPMESINPATGERVASFPTMKKEDLDKVLTAAVQAQKEWAQTPFAERAKLMQRAGVLLKERAKDLAKLMAIEMGKPLKDGVGEINKCAWVCDFYAERAEGFLKPREEPSDAGKSYVRFDPLGVVLAIMPWNFPYWQVFRFIAPHIMAGNGGLLKHAGNVPQCALSIETVMHDAGFPKALFRTILVEAKDVRGIIEDDRIAAVTLTGSEGAGRAVGEASGKAIKRVVLELGGSDAFIVLKDADIDQAAKTAAASRLINAGQSCIAAKRFVVEDAVYDQFLPKFIEAMKSVRVGDPTDPNTDIGPLARVDLRDELHKQVQTAVKQGAKVVLGGEVPKGPGAYYPPTVLVNVTPENVASKEEFFGPVATVFRAKDADTAIAIANETKFGLGASLWTRDPAKMEKLPPRIEAGAVFVNGLVKSDPRLPFGGVKTSGVGRELGIEGIREFVNIKTVWVK